ncbi:MAG: hypothetical protein JXA95_08485, partial [Spirochaetales bacterium]|nr:hypothetical protein [Spirochaetales bacterium]
MKSILLLILSNIRRRKTAFLLMGVSFFIATFLLVSAAELLANLDKAFDSMLDNSRGGNLILEYNLDQYPDRDIRGWWADRPETEGSREYPVHIAREMVFLKGEAVEGTVYVSEAGGASDGTDLLFSDSHRNAPLISVPGPGQIWVSSILRYSHDLKAGDRVGIPTARGIVNFTVSAFIDDPQFNSTWGNKRFWITPGDLYLLGSPLVYTDRLLSVRVNDPKDQERLLGEFRGFLGKSFKGTVYAYGEIKNDYLMIYNIIGMVLAAVSLITIAVALIILSGNLNSFIGSEYRQMGIARAIGFTSSSLVAVYVLEVLIVSLSFSLAAFFTGR